MTSRTHDLTSFASLVTIAANYPPASLNLTTAVVSLVGCTIGSLLPDIDQASNRLWDLLPAGNFLGKFLRNIFLAHRTLSHSLLGLFIFYKFIFLVLPKVLNPSFANIQIIGISIMIGYIAHLIADSFTEEGIPLFFPIMLKVGFPPIKALRIKTGGWIEKFVVFPGVLVYLVWFIVNNQERLLKIFKLVVK